jgi:hypothetical protein
MSGPSILEIESKRTAQAFQRIRRKSLLIPFVLGAAVLHAVIALVLPQAQASSSGVLIALLAWALWQENRKLNALVKILDQSDRL